MCDSAFNGSVACGVLFIMVVWGVRLYVEWECGVWVSVFNGSVACGIPFLMGLWRVGLCV